jgi:CheY-like chemotaxis protein
MALVCPPASKTEIDGVPIAKVLMIDDEPDIRQIGRMSLKGVGKWQVVLASTGVEGVEAAVRERPDLILLDVMMPGQDGAKTLEQLRGNDATRHIPVIFMTARAREQDVQQYLAHGAIGVITKPFDPMTLPQNIRKMVDARS